MASKMVTLIGNSPLIGNSLDFFFRKKNLQHFLIFIFNELVGSFGNSSIITRTKSDLMLRNYLNFFRKK